VQRIVLSLALLLPLAAQAADSTPRVVMVSDQKNGEIRLVIDGQPVMRVTSQTVTVSGDLNFSGVLTDTDNSH
jgi:hypothetical protein